MKHSNRADVNLAILFIKAFKGEIAKSEYEAAYSDFDSKVKAGLFPPMQSDHPFIQRALYLAEQDEERGAK